MQRYWTGCRVSAIGRPALWSECHDCLRPNITMIMYIFISGNQGKQLDETGSTATCVLARKDRVIVANVGDRCVPECLHIDGV